MNSGEQPAVEVGDVYLWPSAEMRQRAIDEAIKVCGQQIAAKIQKEIEDRMKVSIDSWIKEIMTKVTEFQTMRDEAQKILDQFTKLNHNDLITLIEELNTRVTQLEGGVYGTTPQPLLTLSDEDVRYAIKTITGFISQIVIYTKSHHQFNAIQYNLSDHDLRTRILGDMIAETTKRVLGGKLDDLEALGEVAGRI